MLAFCRAHTTWGNELRQRFHTCLVNADHLPFTTYSLRRISSKNKSSAHFRTPQPKTLVSTALVKVPHYLTLVFLRVLKADWGPDTATGPYNKPLPDPRNLSVLCGPCLDVHGICYCPGCPRSHSLGADTDTGPPWHIVPTSL